MIARKNITITFNTRAVEISEEELSVRVRRERCFMLPTLLFMPWE
jgi:hypothetical protein